MLPETNACKTHQSILCSLQKGFTDKFPKKYIVVKSILRKDVVLVLLERSM